MAEVLDQNSTASSPVLDDSFASPTKYPWRVSVVYHGIVNFLFYETEVEARAAYGAVSEALKAGLEYKNDAPRGMVVGDAVGESTLSLIGITNVRLVDERALHNDSADVNRAFERWVSPSRLASGSEGG